MCIEICHSLEHQRHAKPAESKATGQLQTMSSRGIQGFLAALISVDPNKKLNTHLYKTTACLRPLNLDTALEHPEHKITVAKM